MKKVITRLLGAAILVAVLIVPFAPAGARSVSEPEYTYTTIDFPNMRDIYVFDINPGGEIVGSYLTDKLHGFVGKAGDFRTIDYPVDKLTFTNVRGINPAGDIVGYYGENTTGVVRQHGFLLTKHGEWSTIDTALHTDTGLTRILPDGSMVGAYLDGMTNASSMYAVVRNSEGEIISVLDKANTCHESATPNGKTIVGYWGASPRGSNAGYILEDGVFTYFYFSATANSTMAWDISSDGHTIVGIFQNANLVPHGYIAERRGDSVDDWTFTQFDPPGAVATSLFGCNAAGDLVGRYKDASNKWHGFLASRTQR